MFSHKKRRFCEVRAWNCKSLPDKRLSRVAAYTVLKYIIVSFMNRWSRANEKNPLLPNSNPFTGQRIKTTFFIFFSLLDLKWNLTFLFTVHSTFFLFFWGFSCVFSVQHFPNPNCWGQILITRMNSFRSLASMMKFLCPFLGRINRASLKNWYLSHWKPQMLIIIRHFS